MTPDPLDISSTLQVQKSATILATRSKLACNIPTQLDPKTPAWEGSRALLSRQKALAHG